MEITKRLYPSSKYVAVADGAKDNWKFLEPHVDYKILDFYHATEYLSDVSYAYHAKDDKLRKEWQATMCHKLKYDLHAAKDILSEMEKLKKDYLNCLFSNDFSYKELLTKLREYEKFYKRIKTEINQSNKF